MDSHDGMQAQLRQLQDNIAMIASHVGVSTSGSSSLPGVFSSSMGANHLGSDGFSNQTGPGMIHLAGSEGNSSTSVQNAVRQLELRVSSLESHMGTLEGDLMAFKRDTRQTIETLVARMSGANNNTGGTSPSTQTQQQSPSLLNNNLSNFSRYSPIFSSSMSSPMPLSSNSLVNGAGSSSSIPTFPTSATGLQGNAVVPLDSVKAPITPTLSHHHLRQHQRTSSSEPESKKRKRKTDEENKLRELIRHEINDAIDWDIDNSGPGGKPIRKAPQPDKIPKDGLWVPNFTQTIKQSQHNARFIEMIMARLQNEATLSNNPALRPFLLNSMDLRNIVETRFSTIKGDYAAQNSDVKMKAREEKTYKGKQARRGDRKAVKRVQQLIKHEAQLVAEGFPPSLRQGFDSPALHSDEESEEEIGDNGAVVKFCRPIAIPFRSKLMSRLINRVDELIENDRATGERAAARYNRKERKPFQGDLASAPRPPKNKLYRWQIDSDYLKALQDQGTSESELGLLPDSHQPEQQSQTLDTNHFDLTSSHHHSQHQSEHDDYDLSALNQIDPELEP